MSKAESKFTRRAAFAVIGAILIACTFVSPLKADDTGAAAMVAKNVEALRVAMVAGDEKTLNALTDDHLTYGHSHGMVQDKATFVKFLVGPKAPGKFNWIKISDQTDRPLSARMRLSVIILTPKMKSPAARSPALTSRRFWCGRRRRAAGSCWPGRPVRGINCGRNQKFANADPPGSALASGEPPHRLSQPFPKSTAYLTVEAWQRAGFPPGAARGWN